MKTAHYEKSIGENPKFRKFTYNNEKNCWDVGEWEDLDEKQLTTKDGIRFFKIEDAFEISQNAS